jgi:hypothetical protein
MNLGLRAMRRISPPLDLEEQLDALGQLHEIADTSGRFHKYVDDSVPREADVNLQITGGWDAEGRRTHVGCTDGWAIMDEDNNIHLFVTSAVKAEEAMAKAKVSFVHIPDVEGLEDFEDETPPEDQP